MLDTRVGQLALSARSGFGNISNLATPNVSPENQQPENPDSTSSDTAAKYGSQTIATVNGTGASVVSAQTPVMKPRSVSATTSPFIPSEDINSWRDYSRKIVYTAQIDITVPKLGEAEQRAVALAVDADGYVASSTSDMNDAANPNGTWTVRVPCYNFESFVAQLEKLGKVNTASSRLAGCDRPI